jgi:hypothetical protein
MVAEEVLDVVFPDVLQTTCDVVRNPSGLFGFP